MEPGRNFRELSPGSFIYALDTAISPRQCQKIIQHFEKFPQQHYVGRIGQDQGTAQSIKRSTDLRISGRSDWAEIDALLQQSLSHGLSLMSGLHPFFAANQLNDVGYNLQKTEPGEYYHWHVDGGSGEFSKRQLVAIWYLNDVPGPGGETEFYHQKLSINPTAGTLLLFPPYWTHLHRGNTLKSGVKYIATTWVCVC
jgi:Rps23 Pro-64 3,4-dihydroxylase Tpa1-like proline 4-hydroxylase